ncbi:hypothetical protein [Prosthecobacter vanneervenii]|uniref:Phosphatidate cytidylyltransferase n=1 Tax=Prosthecobacter vanneervenii TaxID=48466 RepID=A0A7W7Y6X4_9BACT|nr:hypothetical protein [Prosthecobacter vanneervenii]MBB5030719.1 hypothetical protein [Prosthecobacter vanneervenii]
MDENEIPRSNPRATGRWWKIWLATTLILPAVVGALGSLFGEVFGFFIFALGLADLMVHEWACKKLAPPKSWLYFFLMFGGGVLIVSSFYSGCLVGRTHP